MWSFQEPLAKNLPDLAAITKSHAEYVFNLLSQHSQVLLQEESRSGRMRGSAHKAMQTALSVDGQQPISVSGIWFYVVWFFIIVLWCALVAGVYYLCSLAYLEMRGKVRAVGTWPAGGVRDLDSKQFAYGLCSCVEDPWLCFTSFLCTGCRWSDTMRMTGILAYVTGIYLWIGFTVLSFFGFLLAVLALAGVATYYRQEMRKKLGMDNGELTYITDCLSYAFCTCCAVAQDARQVEASYAVDRKEILDIASELRKEAEPARA
mmetsp:Transcript_49952/g.109125  ORF Transcript_49952/g.109125 Transcript_49952/m.109125 type:complete len:262 (+) Transcript_49952:136-921(+)